MSASPWGHPRSDTPLRLAAAAALLAALPGTGVAQAEEPVAQAVLAAPEPFRSTATVLAHGPAGVRLVREGEGPLICLADDPEEEGFHVACYHESLEPYMVRGRQLRAEGMNPQDALSRRWEEIEAGTLSFPDRAVVYSLSGPTASGELQPLTAIYLKGAGAEELGVPDNPRDGIPWLMFPGRPTAHLMIHDPIPQP